MMNLKKPLYIFKLIIIIIIFLKLLKKIKIPFLIRKLYLNKKFRNKDFIKKLKKLINK